MKKTYIKPATIEVMFESQGVIAASIKINSEKTVDTSNGGQLTNKYNNGWDSSNWQ
ncbi:MAG: hypothetical protein J6R91_01225 [Bacteroidaceae bacterium]|nr:hypothetical protein [Bacteroidaceae bacterium]